MSMRSSGWILALMGLLGLLYFWLTDPVYGMGARWVSVDQIIDGQMRPGTIMGFAGSALIAGIGLWSGVRRLN